MKLSLRCCPISLLLLIKVIARVKGTLYTPTLYQLGNYWSIKTFSNRSVSIDLLFLIRTCYLFIISGKAKVLTWKSYRFLGSTIEFHRWTVAFLPTASMNFMELLKNKIVKCDYFLIMHPYIHMIFHWRILLSNSFHQIQLLQSNAVIRTFKAHYRKQFIQHVIVNRKGFYSTDALVIIALDALCTTASSCKSLTEITIRNTFKQARFTRPTYDKSTSTKATFNNEILKPENTCFHQLAQPFTHHLTIAENIMSDDEFMVSVC